MGKLGRLFGSGVRVGEAGGRRRANQAVAAGDLFDDLWPFCFVPETGQPLSCPEGFSADLPSPVEQAAR